MYMHMLGRCWGGAVYTRVRGPQYQGDDVLAVRATVREERAYVSPSARQRGQVRLKRERVFFPRRISILFLAFFAERSSCV